MFTSMDSDARWVFPSTLFIAGQTAVIGAEDIIVAYKYKYNEDNNGPKAYEIALKIVHFYPN